MLPPSSLAQVVFHPEFLSSTNPLFGLDYNDFVRGDKDVELCNWKRSGVVCQHNCYNCYISYNCYNCYISYISFNCYNCFYLPQGVTWECSLATTSPGATLRRSAPSWAFPGKLLLLLLFLLLSSPSSASRLTSPGSDVSWRNTSWILPAMAFTSWIGAILTTPGSSHIMIPGGT